MRNLFSLLLFCFFISACGAPATSSQKLGVTPSPPSPTQTKPILENCTNTRMPTPGPEVKSLFSPISDIDHVLGQRDAFVTVLVYSDFQCVSCARLAKLLNSIVEKYPQNVRVVFRHFPLESIHDKAALAAQAAEAAHLQGKFWEMHDFLFSNQSIWIDKSPAQFQNWIIDQVSTIGMDKAKFSSDMISTTTTQLIQAAWENGQEIKLPGTPMILINGEIIKWQNNLFDQLEDLILLAMLPQQQFSNCPPLVIDPLKHYSATLVTTKGEIHIKLFADKAPNAVNNFIFLAKNGWYNNTAFFHVIPGVLAQAGDPTGTGLGNPGYFTVNDKNSPISYDRSGIVGMVNAGVDTNNGQFVITLSPASQFNTQYPIFGEVISGLEVVSSLTEADPAMTNQSNAPDLIISISIEEE